MAGQKNVQWNYKLILIIGIILVIISVALFFLKDYKPAYINSINGVMFILVGLLGLLGLLGKNITSWKEMPRGMKIILIILWFGLFSGLWNIYRNFEQTTFILGLPIQFPWSLLVSPLSLLITVFTLIGIYIKKWWKFILIIRGFALINFFAVMIFFFTAPITKILTLTGKDVSNVAPDVLEKIVFGAKLFVSIPMSIGLIIGIIIWVYIYKNREYFSNHEKNERPLEL